MKRWITAALGALSILTMAATFASSVRPFDGDSLERIKADKKGTPFVLVVWSLDCAYCSTSFANLAQERRKRRDLDVVTVSTDPAGDAATVALIEKKLRAAGLKSAAWAFGPVPAEQLRYRIDPQWHGELPRSYWFNRRGERVAYSGVITPAVIASMLDKE